MCDYSLHGVRNRPAKVGEKLVTTDFGMGTRGFAFTRSRAAFIFLDAPPPPPQATCDWCGWPPAPYGRAFHGWRAERSLLRAI